MLERSAPRSKSKSKSRTGTKSHSRTPMLSPGLNRSRSVHHTPLSQIRPRTARTIRNVHDSNRKKHNNKRNDNNDNSGKNLSSYQLIHQKQREQQQPQQYGSKTISTVVPRAQQSGPSGVRAPKLFYTTPTRSGSKKKGKGLSPIQIDENQCV